MIFQELSQVFRSELCDGHSSIFFFLRSHLKSVYRTHTYCPLSINFLFIKLACAWCKTDDRHMHAAGAHYISADIVSL